MTAIYVSLVAMLLASSSAIGTQPSAPPRFHQPADSLPDGANLRLGSERLSHQGTVFCTAFSPDGKLLASGGGYYDETVRLWEPATGKEILRLKHPGPVRDLAWSRDGKLLVTASDGGGIRFYAVATDKQVRHLAQVQPIDQLALSGDRKTLALGEADYGGSGQKNLLRLRDAVTGKELQRFAVERAYSVAFSPDGQFVALGGEEKKIRVWEVRTGKEFPSLQGPKGGTYSVAFSPNGKLLAGGGSYPDSATYLWHWPSGRVAHRLDNHKYTVGAIRFSPDGNTLATGSGNPNGIIQLWDVATGKETRQLKGHRSPIDSLSFSADGKRIASTGSWERTIRLWDVTGATECSPFPRHQGEVNAVAFAPDSRILATASSDQNVFLWKTATGKKVGALFGHQGKVNTIAYSPDGKRLASGSEDKTIRVWQVATGKELHKFQGLKHGATTVAFSPDGRMLAAGVGGNSGIYVSGMRMPDGAVWLWDIATKQSVHVLEAKAGRVNSVAFSPDGRILASAGPDEAMIHLWDPKTGKELRKFQTEPDIATPPTAAEGVTGIVFSPDGKTLASVSQYEYPGSMRAIDDKKTRVVRMVRLWEVATGKERLQLRAAFHTLERIRDERRNDITCAAFSADGQVLILGKKDGNIAHWHIPTGKEIRLTRAHQDLVTAVTLAPDGKTFATASEDTTTLLWKAEALHAPWQTRITANERDVHWADLSSADAPRAYQALWALAGAPAETLALLKERLRPIPKVSPEHIAQWIKALDDNRFVEREKATWELEKLADAAVTQLRLASAKPGSLESSRRIEKLLAKHGGLVPSLPMLRMLRAVELLEQIGNPEARQLLQGLTEGASEARLTREARAALVRLTRRQS